VRRAEKGRRLWRRIRVCLGGSQLDIVAPARKPPSRSVVRASSASGNTGSWAIAAEKVAGSVKIASMSA